MTDDVMTFWPMEMRHTHPHGFRSGEWAHVIGAGLVVPPGDAGERPAYVVRYSDGMVDYVAAGDVGLEFRVWQP